MKQVPLEKGVWAVLLSLVALPETVQGLPAFARTTGMNCQSCHVAYPRLNPFGKTFRDRGYTLQDPSAFQGPWEWKDYFPVALQGMAGFGFEGRDVAEGKFEVQAFQIFAGGQIGPNLSAYLHHHLVLNDGPGELHEAWVRWTVPGTPLSFRTGKFELPLANSPGKTILTHFEPKAYEAGLGANPDRMVFSRHGLEIALNLAGKWTAFLDFIREAAYRTVFARIRRTLGRGEVGVLVQAGQAEIENPSVQPALSAVGPHVQDRYRRAGMDFDLYLNPRLLMSGVGYYGYDDNPHGDGDPGEFVTGYLEFTYVPSFTWLAGLRVEGFRNLRPEGEAGGTQPALYHVGAETGAFPERGYWLNGYLQFYLAPNVKVLAEYLYDAQARRGEKGIMGVHYAF